MTGFSRIRDSLPGVPPLHEDLPFLFLLVAVAGAGFLVAMLYYGEKLRQARIRVRRSEAEAGRARKLYDDFRSRLGPSAIQVEKQLQTQERELAVLRFQLASLRSEMREFRPAEAPTEADIIELGSAPQRRSA